MDRERLKRQDPNSLFNIWLCIQHNPINMGKDRTSQTAELELVDLIQGIGVLPIVLNDVYVVGCCEDTCEGRGIRIP